jgi:hypothetical protein
MIKMIFGKTVHALAIYRIPVIPHVNSVNYYNRLAFAVFAIFIHLFFQALLKAYILFYCLS